MFDDFEYDDDVFRAGLREIVALRAALASLESELVIGARLRGHRWNALAEDLGLTAGGVRKRHLAVDPISRLEPASGPALADVLADLAAHNPT